jgi:hypothetical protein
MTPKKHKTPDSDLAKHLSEPPTSEDDEICEKPAVHPPHPPMEMLEDNKAYNISIATPSFCIQ